MLTIGLNNMQKYYIVTDFDRYCDMSNGLSSNGNYYMLCFGSIC